MSKEIVIATSLLFHEQCGDSRLLREFELINDLNSAAGNFHDSRALYRDEDGFHLSIRFSPMDSSSATAAFGREWHLPNGRKLLSNYCFQFAKFFKLQAARSYALSNGEKNVRKANKDIINELGWLVPVIKRELTMPILERIEAAEFGANRLARTFLGESYLEGTVVSPLRLK